ncbi:MAG: hypothetical protein NTY90_03300, partial [Candidatus Micrarchaeota archaeon]|nr:hypothetical protein [Candidatus Micrarchaeota archaeon]
GVKEELLELCRIRGVGRVRARRLWNAGIKTAEEFRAAPKEKKSEIAKGGATRPGGGGGKGI